MTSTFITPPLTRDQWIAAFVTRLKERLQDSAAADKFYLGWAEASVEWFYTDQLTINDRLIDERDYITPEDAVEEELSNC